MGVELCIGANSGYSGDIVEKRSIIHHYRVNYSWGGVAYIYRCYNGPATINDFTRLFRAPGLSAYQVAVNNGFKGSESEWLVSLIGKDGEQGIQGLQGLTGNIGPQGINGTNGLQGLQGLQGERGFNGTQGPQGIQGERGFNGTQGEQGIQGIQGEVGPQGPTYTPPSLMQLNLFKSIPYTTTPTTLTPTAHSATKAYVFPFEVDRPITVNVVTIRTNAVISNCLILGIYDSSGVRLWQSGALSTVATNTLRVTSNLPITLPVGTYYFATTNNNVVSATAAYTVTSAIGATGFPRWGTVPTTNGAIPVSIDPAAITETTGGWMCYVQLSEVTT